MTLDNFFTSTEVNSGLTTPSRVRELVTIMENESNANIADSTSQWSAVASFITATENKECIDLFVQLNGLQFINNWLKNAQKFGDEKSDSSVEKSITHLVQTVEKLNLDYEKLVSSGLWDTVKGLVLHSSLEVKDKARAVFEEWEKKRGEKENGSPVVTSGKEKVEELVKDPVESTSSGQVESDPNSGKVFDNLVINNGNLDQTSSIGTGSTCEETPKTEASSQKLESIVKEAKKSEDKLFPSSTDAAEAVNPRIKSESPKDSVPEDKKASSYTDYESGAKGFVSDFGFANQSRISGNIKKLDYKFSDREMNRKPDFSNKKKSDAELDYGMVDPLEVARQVAMEVEREFDDYKEQSCSSAEKIDENKSDNDENDENKSDNDESENEASDSATSTENLETNDTPDVENSQEEEKGGVCNFDLNIGVEDSDSPMENQFPPPVSIVLASRAAAPPGLPVSPLQFEGNLGWKGSAATSAFRRMPESSDSSSSKQQQKGFLDFDLNVSDSPIEPNSHSELDLNLDDNSQTDWRVEKNLFPTKNLCSSSTNQQPYNIDLNDQPSFPNDYSYLSKLSQNFSNGMIKSSDSTISLLGTRVEVNNNNNNNRNSSELAFDINLGRSGSFLGVGSVLPYNAHSPVYGYGSIAPPPGGMPFSYGHGPGVGPVPYMVDHSGAPFMVNSVNSGQPLPMHFSQPPYVSNGVVGSSRSSYDNNLNSRMSVGGVSRDPSGLGLFLNTGQNTGPNMGQVLPMDEQMRSGSQSGIGGKRKEPENGLEYNYQFKPYNPTWL